MKSLIALAILFAAATSQASYKQFSCKGNEAHSTPKHLTMTLTAVDKSIDEVDENVKVPYRLVVKNGNRVWDDTIAQVSSEDVVVVISAEDSKGGELSGTIYLDELDQSSLGYVDSGLNLTFDCETDYTY